MGTIYSIIVTGLFMAGLGGLLALLLAIASKRLFVYEDPRIDQVEELLPHSNCGACGTAGCRNFAEQAVAGKIEPARCSVNTPEQNKKIAALLGVAMGDVEKRVARLACAGGKHVARMRANYAGLPSCRAAAVAGGGGKSCAWGCLGLGDCADVCDFDAIHMDSYGLPVVDIAKCTACGDCVDICPKDLFSIQGVSHKLWLACRNEDDPDAAEAACEVACTACGRCVADAAPGLIHLEHNLAVIDYGKNGSASREAIERCPTGAIVWIEGDRIIKGKSAKKIIRTEPLPADIEA
ncbi:(Fe-S)-binding protein [Sideroxydans lithotrophicus]|uniref:Ion-translocating oxidoreductase complex subunit B n=1 Tax=Sideroxydans lithotrophicus (strain ES-1) TaxID=580332 RepID=D5CMP0_SIDLE|nr:(Fe-S)-binding protein [Sideroxydans lithotrophicus]ADE12712.1 Fe-S cluster domain protein [Sideroxydans lithotrophicus ES-1]